MFNLLVLSTRLHNNQWSLNRAKSNVERYYSVVGILEQVNTTLKVFEHKLPYFFKGLQNMYYKDLMGTAHKQCCHLIKLRTSNF